MIASSGARKRFGVGIALFACMVFGAVLRIRNVASQIPIDDEWHGLDIAISRDLWFLFTHFSRAGANSIPWNLYLRAALRTVGWNEVTIVLPSLLAGVGLLWVFPRWVARRFGAVPALVSEELFAAVAQQLASGPRAQAVLPYEPYYKLKAGPFPRRRGRRVVEHK